MELIADSLNMIFHCLSKNILDGVIPLRSSKFVSKVYDF